MFRQNESRVKVTLIEASQILNSFDKRLQKYAEKKMRQRENFKLVQSTVTGISESAISLFVETYFTVDGNFCVKSLFGLSIGHRQLRWRCGQRTRTLIWNTQVLSSLNKNLGTELKALHCGHADVRANSVNLADGTVIPCGLVVWSTGLAPRFFTRGLQVPKNGRGQVSLISVFYLFAIHWFRHQMPDI